MTDKSVEKELFDLETQYWQAMKSRDFETGLSLADDPCLVVGPQGIQSIDKEKFREMMNSAPYDLRDFKLSDVKARSLADDVAILGSPLQ